MTEENMTEKNETANITLTRNENKLQLKFLENELTEEFSTADDAVKAENIASNIMKLVQWLMKKGAVFVDTEIETTDVENETVEENV